MATYQHVTLYSPHRRLRLGAHIRACAPENRQSFFKSADVLAATSSSMRTQCASTSCPHRSQSPCSHFATSTLRIPRYTSTSCLQLHNFDATTALLQLNACQSTSLLRCTSSPTTQQHLASTCPTTSMQLNATPSAAPEFHQKRLQITCGSLASHLNLHDPMPLYMPHKIRTKSNLVCSTLAARPEQYRNNLIAQ